jgi:hypothetical protein
VKSVWACGGMIRFRVIVSLPRYDGMTVRLLVTTQRPIR